MPTLKEYYTNFFPCEDLFHFLQIDPFESSNREFSFTLTNDAYLRYKSYKNTESLKGDLIELIPSKIDIGAIYSYDPSFKKSDGAMEINIQYRELVLDIDISDYDDVRGCCKEKEICSSCWKLLVFAVNFISTILKGLEFKFF